MLEGWMLNALAVMTIAWCFMRATNTLFSAIRGYHETQINDIKRKEDSVRRSRQHLATYEAFEPDKRRIADSAWRVTMVVIAFGLLSLGWTILWWHFA